MIVFTGSESVFRKVAPPNGVRDTQYASFIALINSSPAINSAVQAFSSTGGAFVAGTGSYTTSELIDGVKTTVVSLLPGAYSLAGDRQSQNTLYPVMLHELSHAVRKAASDKEYFDAQALFSRSPKTQSDFDRLISETQRVQMDDEAHSIIAVYNAAVREGKDSRLIRGYVDEEIYRVLNPSDGKPSVVSDDEAVRSALAKVYSERVPNVTTAGGYREYYMANIIEFAQRASPNSQFVINFPNVDPSKLVAGGFTGAVVIADSKNPGATYTLTVGVESGNVQKIAPPDYKIVWSDGVNQVETRRQAVMDGSVLRETRSIIATIGGASFYVQNEVLLQDLLSSSGFAALERGDLAAWNKISAHTELGVYPATKGEDGVWSYFNRRGEDIPVPTFEIIQDGRRANTSASFIRVLSGMAGEDSVDHANADAWTSALVQQGVPGYLRGNPDGSFDLVDGAGQKLGGVTKGDNSVTVDFPFGNGRRSVSVVNGGDTTIRTFDGQGRILTLEESIRSGNVITQRIYDSGLELVSTKITTFIKGVVSPRLFLTKTGLRFKGVLIV